MADEDFCFMQPRCSEIQTAASDVFVTRVRTNLVRVSRSKMRSNSS
jgi:hypothetical protein